MTVVRSAIAGYEITGVIMEGKNSTVYSAVDYQTRWEVAIKTVSRRTQKFKLRARQLKWEFRLRDRLQHPGIVKMYKYGRSRGLAYLVMEYCAGKNLRELMRARDPALREHADEFVQQLVGGLAHAHHNGVVHRDVKPENVIVATEGELQVKLLDFAIAVLYAQGWKQWLRWPFGRGGIRGTKTYMSPEQVQGRPLDPRSDIYSLGIMLFEMVAGRPPFLQIDADQLLEAHVSEEPPALSRFAADVNPAFEELVAMMLRKNRDLRPPDLSFVQKQLHDISVYR
ncbi:MAG TPA: serine/threonine-protein kinase [Planctomycetota bacterium]|nr:serine/threonine-protein kinase [Planctomycetota bacterium]